MCDKKSDAKGKAYFCRDGRTGFDLSASDSLVDLVRWASLQHSIAPGLEICRRDSGTAVVRMAVVR